MTPGIVFVPLNPNYGFLDRHISSHSRYSSTVMSKHLNSHPLYPPTSLSIPGFLLTSSVLTRSIRVTPTKLPKRHLKDIHSSALNTSHNQCLRLNCLSWHNFSLIKTLFASIPNPLLLIIFFSVPIPHSPHSSAYLIYCTFSICCQFDPKYLTMNYTGYIRVAVTFVWLKINNICTHYFKCDKYIFFNKKHSRLRSDN